MAPRIAIVEDDGDIRYLLEHLLTREGYEVVSAADGPAGVELVRDGAIDLLILDLMLPGYSGTEILKRVRHDGASRPKVILLTARKDEVDRVLGFELGADDYVTKPFSTRELLLRVQAVLRRGSAEAPASSPGEGVLRAGPITLDPSTHSVTVDGKPLSLTLTEFRLLADLVQARGRVRSRENLLSELWGYDVEVLSRTVDTHIRRLREKLGSAAPWLVTVRGVGYRVLDPSKQ